MNPKINKILIIEDDIADQAMYQRYLKRGFGESIELIIKEDGISALTYLKTNTVDCILLDYNLPDMDGNTILERILSNDNIRAPVIMLTGQGSEKVAVKALKLGAYDYYQKGDLKSEMLHKAIVNAIEKSSLARKIKEQQSEIKFMTYHDYLTGAANRIQFEQLADKILSRANTNKENIAILMVNLDHFKNVNISFGHEIGDLLLLEVTRRFLSVLQKTHILARMGSDEFAVIIDTFEKPEEIEVIANYILSSLKEPFIFNAQSISISASIGIAISPDAGNTVSTLIRSADSALDTAKKEGNTFFWFSKKLGTITAENARIETFLKEALLKKKFYLCYQPILNLHDHSLYGVEALLRWNDTDFSELTNDQVIPAAEESGLIVPIGDWVIETALKQYKEWDVPKNNPLKLSINLSPKQINKKNLVVRIEHLMTSIKIDPRLIIFELTESAIVNNIENAISSLNVLKNIGCEIFLDDFGSGYSSINLIRNLPISGLKIDKSFIHDIDHNPQNAHLLKMIFSLAESMNFIVISEGIENVRELSIVKSFDESQKGQGHYLSHPISADATGKLLRGM